MSLEELREVVGEINRQYNLTPLQLLEIVQEELHIPLVLFNDRRLGVLETLVKYMKENLGMKYVEIARILNRDNRTIWATYDKATKKVPTGLPEAQGYLIPINIFANRKQGVLQVLAKYAYQKLDLTYSQTAKLLNRDPRTIWCVVNK